MVQAAKKTDETAMGRAPSDAEQDSSAPEQGEGCIGIVGVDYSVEQYLTQRKVPFSEAGTHRKVVCPSCKGLKGKKKTKSLLIHNEIGTWSCGTCSRNGGFKDLRRLLGETDPVSVAGDRSFETWVPKFRPIINYVDWVANTRSPEAQPSMQYLESIGIFARAARDKLMIGYDTKLDALVFSYQYERSPKTASYLRFMRRPDDWWKVTGNAKTASWFGQHLFKPGADEAYICQTPLDASVLIAMGETNVLASHSDVPDVRYRTHHLAMLQRCSVVYVVPNPTDDGMKWAAATQSQIGKWRCKIVQMDMYPRDIIKNDAKSSWETAKAKSDSSFGISTHQASSWISEVDYEWDHPDETKGGKINLEPMDKLLAGWRPGEVTVLSGASGVGKSTFASFLSLLQASEKVPTLYMTFEVLPKNILRKWISMLSGEGFYHLARTAYVQARKRLARRPIWIADNYGMVALEDVRKSIYDAASRHNVRFVVIDHLGHLASLGKEDQTKETGNIIRECKRWSLDLAVHILLVAHLRKPSPSAHGKPQMEDLRGSSEVYQVADNVLLLGRSRGQTKCQCRIVKCRDDAGYEGIANLDFDERSLRYTPGEQHV